MRRMPGLRQWGSSLVREIDSSFFRFVAVGLSNFAISLTVFRVLLALPWTFQFKASVCQLVSYATGTIWSFVWNRRFTFRSKGSIRGQALRFVSLQTGLALASAAVIARAASPEGRRQAVTALQRVSQASTATRSRRSISATISGAR